MNNIYREASNKFNMTQAQAENIYLSVFKFIKSTIKDLDYNNIEDQKHSFILPHLGKIRVNVERVKKFTELYKERTNGEDCTYS